MGREQSQEEEWEPGTETMLIKRPRRFRRVLVGVLALAVTAGTAVLGVVAWFGWQYLRPHQAPSPNPAAAAAPADAGGERDREERGANAATAHAVPADGADGAVNLVDKVVAAQADAPAAKPVAWGRRAVPLQPAVAEVVTEVAGEIRRKLGLDIGIDRGWMDGAEPPAPGTDFHAAAGVDVSAAAADGREVLTLDLKGKPILLDDVATAAGAARFTAVLKKLLARDLKKLPAKHRAKLVDGWLGSAAADLRAGVWGMHDATMEVWARHGWSIGHCGARPGEPRHAEPAASTSCSRFSEAYTAALLAARGMAAPDPDADAPRRGGKARKGGMRKGGR